MKVGVWEKAERVISPVATLEPGVWLALAILCVYGGFAVSVDIPRASGGFFSDEATYYMIGRSVAEDGDIAYRREDLVRVWEEFSSGPTGLFLKRGRDIVDVGVMRKPPFVWTTTQPDPDPSRLFYGKSFIYPLFAAPFLRLFGTNGFLVFHALLLALVSWCGYVFLRETMAAAIAAALTGAFLLATVLPVYFVWISPEMFNFALGVYAYFCWLYKEVGSASDRVRPRWLLGPAGDIVAAILLGIATFSKISNALLFPPIVLLHLWRRQWTRALVSAAAFVAVTGGLFAMNTAITGEWNYQGGERRTYYWEFPYQTPKSVFEVGLAKSRDEALTEIIFERSVFWKNLRSNFVWYFTGRYSGLVAYFFPAVLAMVAFLTTARRRPAWQFLVFGAGLAQIFLFVIGTPYTWMGGGGSVGNRYFIGAYGIFLFLLPPLRVRLAAVVPWLVGGLFMGKLVLNPFATSFSPGRYADHGPLRWLPVELTNVNDLPINTDSSRVRVWFGDNEGEGDPGFQIYFLDDKAYGREADKSFWVKGASRAQFLIKTDRPMRRLVLTLSAGPVATRARATLSGRTWDVLLGPGASQQVSFNMPEGFPYQGRWPVWVASVSSSSGFVPVFEEGSTDTRYLGVRVKPMLVE
jgi:hypothetical protein